MWVPALRRTFSGERLHFGQLAVQLGADLVLLGSRGLTLEDLKIEVRA